MSKNVATVQRIQADGNFRINLAQGQDGLTNNSKRSGLFKMKNGPEAKVTPHLNNLIIK